MKRIFLLFFLSFFLDASNDLCAMKNGQAHEIYNSAAQWPAVKKINENFYVSQVSDTFYLVMERITQDNILEWIKYAANQCRGISVSHFEKLNTDGAGHFQSVLNCYYDKEINPRNDLWVAYASCIPVINKISPPEFDAIDLYMSVITSKDALITSHMGISRSVNTTYDLEAHDFIEKGNGTLEEFKELSKYHLLRKKFPYQSMYLHSFATKVMLIIDHNKIYMLTAPTNTMRLIILKKMPQESVFVGDDFYKEELEDETIPDINRRVRLGIRSTNKKRRNSAKLERIQKQRSLLKTNPPRIIRADGNFTIQQPNEEALVTFDSSTQEYQWFYTDPYRTDGLTCPYVLVSLDALATFES